MKRIAYLLIFIALGISFSSCEKNDDVKVLNKVQEGELRSGYFHFSNEDSDYIEVWLMSSLSLENKKTLIRLSRSGNVSKIDGHKEFAQDPKSVSYGFSDYCSATYNQETNEFTLNLPPKGSDKYIRMIRTRDVISLKYTPEKDALLIKVKTALQDGDGDMPTYELKRSEKSIVRDNLEY